MYVGVYTYVCVCVYTHIHTQRHRHRHRHTHTHSLQPKAREGRAKYPDTSPAPTTINRSIVTPTKMKNAMAKAWIGRGAA
jgi:hypothetical protein